MSVIQITVREGAAYLSEVPPEAQEPLMLATSFRPAGYQYTTLFQKGRTDGRVKLLKHSKCPAGLLGRVLAVLDEVGVGYVIDAEAARDDKPGLDVETMGLESRWYQDEAVEAALLNPRGVIRAPTGAGKTAIIARVIADRRKHAFVIVPTIDLLHQTREFLERHLVDATLTGRLSEPASADWFGHAIIGQMGDGIVDPRPITVATVRTAAKALGVAYETYEFGEYDDRDNTDVDAKALRQFFKQVGTVIVDEAHILGAQTVFDVTTKIPAPNKYGFSASPWRDDGADLMIEAATGPVIYQISAKTLVDGGFLVPPVIRVLDTTGWWKPAAWGQVCARCGAQRGWEDKDGGGRQRQKRCIAPVRIGGQWKGVCGSTSWRSEYQQAYAAEIVDNPIRNTRLANIVQGKDPTVGPLDGATLLLVKQVKHGRALAASIPGAVFLSGKDSGAERLRAFNAIRAGLTTVLVATTIADLGLDLPVLKNLVLAAGGKSSTRHLQRIGRVARPYRGKRFARVIDLDDGHVHKWFGDQAKARRKVEREEWGEAALWV